MRGKWDVMALFGKLLRVFVFQSSSNKVVN